MGHLRDQMLKNMQLRNFSQSTIKAYLGQMIAFTKYFGRSPQELGEKEIKEYLYYLRFDRKVSWSYLKITYSAFKFFYIGTLHKNMEISKIPYPKSETRLPVIFSYEEIEDLLNHTYNFKHKVILMTLYSAGLRVSEVCKLKVIDIDSRRMQIRVEQGKGKKDRYTLLSEKLLDFLRIYYRYSHPEEWLFYGRCRTSPISIKSVQKVFRKAKSKAGIKKQVTVHSLRHSFATHLLEQGVDLLTIKELLGHSNLKTTSIYIHLRKQHLDKVKSPFDNLVLQNVSG